MDRLRIGLRSSHIGILFFILGLLVVLTIKAFDEGWFVLREPLTLNDKPALLFFNRYEGCECVLVVYEAAQYQIEDWSDEERHEVQLVMIDLDRRPDLGKQYNVIRAPTLILLNEEGSLIYKQDEVVTDAEPLNLPLFEEMITEVLNAK